MAASQTNFLSGLAFTRSMSNKKREHCPDGYFDLRSYELLDDSEFPVYKEEGYYASSASIRYTAVDREEPETPLTYIRGNMTTHKGQAAFYVSRIVNATGDPYIAIKTLPLVFSALEADLREQGVCWLTAKSLYGLAPIAKRYGFRPASKADELKMRASKPEPSQPVEQEEQEGFQSYDTISLEKRL